MTEKRKTPGPSLIYIGHLSTSPIGPLWVAVSEHGLVAVEWGMTQEDFTHLIQQRHPSQVLYDEIHTAEPLRQLSDYLAGTRREFNLPIDWSRMSPFQAQVLRLTAAIPYGQTSTYKELAIQVGRPRAPRAVGRAEATNPMPLVLPCHRVLGSDGKLHGYGGPGGIELKAWLLKLEQSA